MKPLSRLVLLTIVAALALGVVPSANTAHAATLLYADEFNGPLDTSVWANLTPWNTRYTTGELQYYNPGNVTFGNGAMRILTERRSMNGYDYTSGIVTSLNRPKFTYGYFEARAKLPKGKGVWPAIWLTNDRTLEIDIMELLGERPERVYMTYHRGPQVYQSRYDLPSGDFSDGYHTFAVDWQPSYIRWYVDGVLRGEYKGSIPSDPMWLIFNTAVGGRWPLPPDHTTPLPQEYLIDYVRVYDRKPSASAPAPAPTEPAPTTGTVTVHRFYKPDTGTHFFTASADERDAVATSWPGVFRYEGVAYTLEAPRNSWPLYRFYNRLNGSHFYTVSRTERDLVLKNLSDVYAFEGEAFKVSRTADVGPAVHRFYNRSIGAHFFTASVAERDIVMANYPHVYTYEGVPFYLGQ
ncbi:MAG: family 16 glycosylhydrolase [Coriobacteriia bacterium]